MPRLKLCIAYEGTAFAGWQCQLDPKPAPAGLCRPNLRTVQWVLEEALNGIVGEMRGHSPNPYLRLTGSGRTDAGVHAEGQVAHFDVPEDIRPIDWQRALNHRLPDDVSIISATWADADFNARFDAVGKTYTYSLWLERAFLPPRLRNFVWQVGPLRLDLMQAAAALLPGEHDFAAFQNAGGDPGPTIRTLYSVDCHPLPWPEPVPLNLPQEAPESLRLYSRLPRALATPGHAATYGDSMRNAANAPHGQPYETPFGASPFTEPGSPHIRWSFTGSGFLKQMVRNLMGLLVAVGQEKVRPEDVPPLLDGRDRKAMPGVTAPPQGLCLHRVFY